MASIDSILSAQGTSRTGEPGPSLGESAGFPNMLGAVGNSVLDVIPSRTTTKINKGSQTILSPEAINQVIYEALSGSSGISAIKSGEAASGGYGSSTAALQSADLLAEVASQIGQATGPKVQQSETTTKKKKSIICTRLYELGDIPRDLYFAGQQEFQRLPPEVIEGYHSWGYPVSELLDTRPLIRKVAKFIALARYKYVLEGKWSLLGWMTVAIGEPICGVIGYARRKRIYC